jgi:hypothetical protein
MGREQNSSMFDFVHAIDDIIRSADPGKRKVLATKIDRYKKENSPDFLWATGPQAPTLLHNIMLTIEWACQVDIPQSRQPQH